MKEAKLAVALCALALVLGPAVWVARAQDFAPEVLHYADMVFYNGHVLTMDRDQAPFTVTEALAVRDGRILAVGEDERILRMAGPDTARMNLDGRAVMPGIIDTHSHPQDYARYRDIRAYQTALVRGLRSNGIRYITANWETMETVLASFKKGAEVASDGQWIYTAYFSSVDASPEVARTLSRFELDTVAPNNPIWIKKGQGSTGITNTRMLEIIQGIYGQENPGYLKNEEGALTGQLRGPIAETVMKEVIPPIPPELLAPLYKKELEDWLAYGVTTISSKLTGEHITAFSYMDREGILPLRVAYSHEIGVLNNDLERNLRRWGGIQGHGTDRVWLIGISINNTDDDPPGAATGMGGGICTTVPKIHMLPGDAYPEGNCNWDMPGDPSQEAPSIVNRYGYRVSGVHAYGDKGVLQGLAAFAEANREKSILGKRFALDHGPMISPEIIRQAAELGVMWSLQPSILYRYSGMLSQVFGEEIAQRWAMPTKSLIEAGVKVAYGADRRDFQKNPMFNLEVFVTRKNKDGRVYGEREKIDRATTLLMMTRWGSEYVLREKELGSLEPGKIADLAVLDKNPLDPSIPDEDLSEIKVVATIIGGEVVYGSLDPQ
ncbi:MAG: amidohydrolase family protein [Acidobacteria bacterium]|nr:amidohydrolase family protein [Acidobacteriota bacterium]